MDILCEGPGPHKPPSGILGTSTVLTSGMRCPEVACQPEPGIYGVNSLTIRQLAADALATNRTYVALAAPTAAQSTAQMKALTRQVNGLIRLMLGQLDGTD